MKLFITVLFLSSKLIANCYNLNNFDSSNNLKDLKIVNQGDMSTCYAHTLAALYNLNQTSENDYLHPYWVAFKHKDKNVHWSPKNMDYSLLSWAWSDMLKKSMCGYEQVNQILKKYKNGVDYSDDQFFYLVKTFFSLKKGQDTENKDVFRDLLLLTTEKLKKDSFGFEKKWNDKDVKTIFSPIASQIGKKKIFDFFKEDMFESCERNLSKPQGSLSWTGRGIETNDDIYEVVAGQLISEKSVAIGYCSRPVFTEDPRTSQDITNKVRLTKSFSKKCSAHYSMIVGSREKNNKCEILIRNSYGTGFWAHKSSTCYCENSQTNEKFNCTKDSSVGHKVLGCWVNKDKLFNNTYDISYFN